MMGFGEEAGVIPRFCHELFSRLASMENEKVPCHLEAFIVCYRLHLFSLCTQNIFLLLLHNSSNWWLFFRLIAMWR